ncbi:MAG: hypothetical protein HY515_03120 [Candidatus Aenigmarchaeota archaeon]|nr:hypothetical protein [Candidatus Aenigmarchaeota archaeon]
MGARKKISDQINDIKTRNRRVEADKAWETSRTRRFMISVATYLTIGIFLSYIKAPDPFVVALVPTVGYLLSTLTMTAVKKLWLGKIYNRKSGR